MDILKNSFRLTKPSSAPHTQQPPLPILHAVGYSLLALFSVIAFTFFLIIRHDGSITIPAALDFVIWVAFAALGAFLYSKLNRRIGRAK